MNERLKLAKNLFDVFIINKILGTKWKEGKDMPDVKALIRD